MFVKHPTEKVYINLAKYADIRCCPVNPTHIDFYEKAVATGERGKPDYTIVFASPEEKDDWFREFLRDERLRFVDLEGIYTKVTNEQKN